MPAPEPQSVHNLLVFLPVQEQEESDYAVIPQENTIGGAVIDYVDTLISQNEVSIVGEVELPIRQNLLGLLVCRYIILICLQRAYRKMITM